MSNGSRIWKKNKIIDDNSVHLRGYLWNALASIAAASSSVFVLAIVKRYCGIEMGASFSIAVAITNLTINIGHLNVFGFQVSDINEEFSYRDYFLLRVCSVIAMIIISYIYIFVRGYEVEKSALLFSYCLYRGFFSFFDLIQGRYQQKNRVDLGAKYSFFKILVPDTVLALVVIFSSNLLIAIIGACVTLILISLIVQFCVFPDWFSLKCKRENKIRLLFIKCIPVFYFAFANALVLNSSKYVIDYYLDDKARFYYAVLMLPATTIHMMLGFAYRPALTDFAWLWNNHKHKELNHKIHLIDLLAISALLFILVVSKPVIIPILSFLYHLPDLNEYVVAFAILLVSGGMQAVTVLYSYLLTIVRGQSHFVWIYTIVLALAIVIPVVLTKKHQFLGASMAYLILSFVQMILLMMTYRYVFVRGNAHG